MKGEKTEETNNLDLKRKKQILPIIRVHVTKVELRHEVALRRLEWEARRKLVLQKKTPHGYT